MIIFHGTTDPVISYTCATDAQSKWAARNGCATTTHSVTVTGGHCDYSDGCPADGQVVLCSFDNMSHVWAGGTGTFGDATKASATDLGWSFFKQYAW